MKRLLVYFSVLVGCLFVGLTTYYMLKDYDMFFPETQGVSAEADYNLNVGETAEYKFTIDKKSDDTEMLYSFDNEGVATYDLETGIITAVKGGTTNLKVYTNKENLGHYECSIVVGDGSDNNAWIIDSKEDLAAIGTTRKFAAATVDWKLSDNYELLNDIELNGDDEWEPIGGKIVGNQIQYFTGKFNGNHHTIKNLTMTQDCHYAGLFGAVGEMATITSVKLDNVNISGYYFYGGSLVGLCVGAEMKGVEVTNANITINARTNEMLNWWDMDENNVGGIVGLNQAFIDGDIIHHSKLSLMTFDGNIKLNAPATVKTRYSVGGILGYNLGAEIHNNKAVVNFEIANGLTGLTNKQVIVGGIVGTSYIHNPKNTTFTENKDKEVVYAIIMNNLAIMNHDNTPAVIGGIIGHNAAATQSVLLEDVTDCTLTDAEQKAVISRMNQNIVSRITGNMFYAYDAELTMVYAGCEPKSLEALKAVATYNEKNWAIATPDNADEGNFAWVIVDGEQVATIDYEGSNEEHDFSLTTIELNQDNFASYIAKMLDNTSHVAQKYWLSREYKLTSDIDLTQLFPNWTPISYRETDPTFTGTFDGNGFTIKNVNIVNIKNVDTQELNFVSVGLFASIGSTGIVKNLKVENVEIDFAGIGGAIAGVNYGLIENCQVTAVHIKDSLTAGFVVGHNKGVIRTTKTISEEDTNLQYTVLADMEAENTIANLKTDANVFMGGIAGYNAGKIVGARIEANFKLDGATVASGAVSKMLGGIAGYNGGEIILSSVENANIKDLSKVYTYIGGIAGLSNGLIDRCHAGLTGDGYSASIIAEVNKANNLVGGIAGQLSMGAEIKQSFVKADITAYYAGGIAANLFGKVTECYVLGTITGEYVGGISVNVSLSDTQSEGGYVADCYVRATLKGNTETARVAGLSTYIIHPGKFERIILSVNFGGLGDKYFESYTDTRTGFYNFVNSFAGTKLGRVYNIIIDKSIVKAEDKVQENGGVIEYEGQSVYYTDTDTIQSGETFYVEKGFGMSEGGIWFMTAGQYPELRNVNLDGNDQNPIVEEEAGEPEEVPGEGAGTEEGEGAGEGEGTGEGEGAGEGEGGAVVVE